MAATMFSIIPLSLFIHHTIPLYRNESGASYCKLGKQLFQIVLGNLLYGAYIVVSFVHEGALLRLDFTCHDAEDTVFNSLDKVIFKESISSTLFREQLETAKSNTVVENEDALRVTPRPFILDGKKESILSLENIHVSEWMALRVLVSSPNSYSICPQKVIIPPQRSSTVSFYSVHCFCCMAKALFQISVQLRNDTDRPPSTESGLMLQWFTVGKNCLCVDVTRLWQRPYLVPRSCWKFYVLPIYHDSSDNPPS
ncbi:hypothetical protein Aduo_015819 [Ancylostoma duodenale]